MCPRLAIVHDKEVMPIIICSYMGYFYTNMSPISSVVVFKASFPALTGLLTLAYLIHNCILSIMRNQENPKNNVSDPYYSQVFIYLVLPNYNTIVLIKYNTIVLMKYFKLKFLTPRGN